MSEFKVTILGCGSATPTLMHMPTAQAVQYGGRVMLIDCGEGTQLQLRRYRVPYSRITDIFVSHLHGDHCLGLPGLLSTLALHQIGGTVTVHIFRQGAEWLDATLKQFCRERPFNLEYNIIDPGAPGILLNNKTLSVKAFSLSHRVPCVGFIFKEKPKLRHIDGEAVRYHNIPHYAMQSLREGMDWASDDGTIIPNERLTSPPSRSASYAYASDTAFNPQVAMSVRGVDVLYHESTYGDDNEAKAEARGHSTARQAAEIAKLAGVQRLYIGHYSKRITDPQILVEQARTVFPQTFATNEGLTIDI